MSNFADLVAGQELVHVPSHEIVRQGLVQVPEGRRVFPNLSVRDNLELGSYRRGKPDRARNLEKVVSIFPRLKERWTQAAGTLSGAGWLAVGVTDIFFLHCEMFWAVADAGSRATPVRQSNVRHSARVMRASSL